MRQDIILRHAKAFFVKEAEVVLCGGIVLLGRFPVLLHRLGVVLRHAKAGFVQEAEVALGHGQSLV